jgi:hypothetical protein
MVSAKHRSVTSDRHRIAQLRKSSLDGWGPDHLHQGDTGYLKSPRRLAGPHEKKTQLRERESGSKPCEQGGELHMKH